MKSQTFSFEFSKEVPLETLASIWEKIRQDLIRKGYRVENLQMPGVRAYVMNQKDFAQTFKELLESPHIRDEGEKEWGKSSKASTSACIFYADVSQEYIILKCEGDPPLEVDLNHELRHLYESYLGLQWGSLTAKNTT